MLYKNDLLDENLKITDLFWLIDSERSCLREEISHIESYAIKELTQKRIMDLDITYDIITSICKKWCEKGALHVV